MKKLLIGLYILISIVIVFHLIQLTPKNKGDVALIEAGEKLYKQNCSSCHGESGLGEGAFQGTAINNQQFLNTYSDQDLYNQVKFGRKGTLMPAYPSLSEKQLKQIVAFMRSWQTDEIKFEVPKEISGNSDNGKRIYGLYCLSCHGAEGVGKKKMGTALSNAEYLQYTTDKQIWIGTAYGRDNTRMAASLKGLKGVRQLTKDEISDVTVYIRSLEKK